MKHGKIKKKMSTKISNLQIDKMYEMAIKNGAIGGKVTGAGEEVICYFIVHLKRNIEL